MKSPEGAEQKLLIATMCNGDLEAEYVISLFSTIKTMAKEAPHIDINLNVQETSLVHFGRNNAWVVAEELGVHWLMFIDSDMTFDHNHILRLIENDVDIVSGLYFQKGVPYKPLVYIHKPESKKYEYARLEDIRKERLFKCDGVGAGFLLIKHTAIQKFDKEFTLKEGFPFDLAFTCPGMLGEDFSFCYRAKKLGMDIYCDSTVMLGHIGKHYYGINEHVAYNESIGYMKQFGGDEKCRQLFITALKEI